MSLRRNFDFLRFLKDFQIPKEDFFAAAAFARRDANRLRKTGSFE